MTAATSKMEHFVIIVNGFQPLTIITKSSILVVAAVLDPPLVIDSADAYPYFTDPYCGAKYSGGKVSKNFCAVCARSVIDFVTEVNNWDDKQVLFHNWFLLLPLITVLKDQEIHAT